MGGLKREGSLKIGRGWGCLKPQESLHNGVSLFSVLYSTCLERIYLYILKGQFAKKVLYMLLLYNIFEFIWGNVLSLV